MATLFEFARPGPLSIQETSPPHTQAKSPSVRQGSILRNSQVRLDVDKAAEAPVREEMGAWRNTEWVSWVQAEPEFLPLCNGIGGAA